MQRLAFFILLDVIDRLRVNRKKMKVKDVHHKIKSKDRTVFYLLLFTYQKLKKIIQIRFKVFRLLGTTIGFRVKYKSMKGTNFCKLFGFDRALAKN